MIAGTVNVNREPIVRLTLYDTNGRDHEFDVLVDTGFTAWLTLPPDIIGALGLSWREWSAATLADGSRIVFDVYNATILWDGQVIHIPVDEADAHPLVGMALLDGYRIIIEDVDAGRVVIERI